MKFSIRLFSSPASFFSVKLRVSESGQKWSLFVPVTQEAESLLSHWKRLQMTTTNITVLGKWMTQFIDCVFDGDDLVDASFHHEAFRMLCHEELQKLLLLMIVKIQRRVRTFLHHKRVQRRHGGHTNHTISSSKYVKPKKPYTRALQQGHDKDVKGRTPVLAVPDFETVLKYKHHPSNQQAMRQHSSAPHSAGASRKPNSSSSTIKPSPRIVLSQGSTPVTRSNNNNDDIIFSELIGLRNRQAKRSKEEEQSHKLEDFKYDDSFFSNHTPVDSGSVFIMRGSEEFPSVPSPPNHQQDDTETAKQDKERKTRDIEVFDILDDKEENELQQTAEKFGFAPSKHDVDYSIHDNSRSLENVENDSKFNNANLSDLFDTRVISKDYQLESHSNNVSKKANKKKHKKNLKKSKRASSAPSKKSSRSSTAISKNSSTTSANEDQDMDNLDDSTEVDNRVVHKPVIVQGQVLTRRKPNSASVVDKRQNQRSGDRRSPEQDIDSRYNSHHYHIPQAKRVTTIKEEREVRRLHEVIDNMKKEVTSLKRKVRYRDKRIRIITPIYLQPRNEMYQEAATILQPVIRAHQQKKYFKKKSMELHEDLRHNDDGTYVHEALEVGLASGNHAMAVDAIRRSFEVVSALNDAQSNKRYDQQWHGIKYIPCCHEEVLLICEVILAFVSIEEVANFGLQLLSIILSLRDFEVENDHVDRYDVMGAAGACDVVMIILSRYCQDTVMCTNALKLCKHLTKTSVKNRERCVNITYCRSLCNVLLRQHHVLQVLEKAILVIRRFCIDVDGAVKTFHQVGLFENLTHCMRTYKTSSLFAELCKTVTTICCKETSDSSTMNNTKSDFSSRANCLIFIDGLVANRLDEVTLKHAAVMMICVCENDKEAFQRMVTDHLIKSLNIIIHDKETSVKAKKITFDFIFNLMRNFPDDPLFRKMYNKLEILLSQDDEDDRCGDEYNFDASLSQRSDQDNVSFLETGQDIMMENSLTRNLENTTTVDEDHRSVVTFRHQVKDANQELDVVPGGAHQNEEPEDDSDSDIESKRNRAVKFEPEESQASRLSKSLNNEDDILNNVDEVILNIVRTIREACLTLFNDASVQNALHYDFNNSCVEAAEEILSSLSYTHNFKSILDKEHQQLDGAKKVELCVAYTLVYILSMESTPVAVMEANLILLDYLLGKESHALLQFADEIEKGSRQWLWNQEYEIQYLPARLKSKLACFLFNVKQRILHDQNKKITRSASESEFLDLVEACSQHDEVSKFLRSSIEECHHELAHRALLRVYTILCSNDIQDDPPKRDDLAQFFIDDEGCNLLLEIMLFFVQFENIQSIGLDVLHQLFTMNKKLATIKFGEQRAIEVVNVIIWEHITSEVVSKKMLECSILLTSNKMSTIRKHASVGDTFEIIDGIMSNFASNGNIMLKSCHYISQMSSESEGVRKLILNTGIDDNIMEYLKDHIETLEEDEAEIICRAAISVCADQCESHIRFFSSPNCLEIYTDIMKSDRAKKRPVSRHICRLLVVLTEPGYGFVIENLLKCNFAVELQRVLSVVLQYNVLAMLNCLRFVSFICQSSLEFRHRFHSTGVTEILLCFLQDQSNNSDVIVASTHTLLNLCENTEANLLLVMNHKNLYNYSRILRNNVTNGKICRSVCAMMMKLSSGGEKAIMHQYACSGIAPELAAALEKKKIDSDAAQSILLLIIHVVNVVNALGQELIAANIPAIVCRFSANDWPSKFHDLSKLTKDALVHDDDVKYDLLHSSGAKIARIDAVYVHQNIIEHKDSETYADIGEVGILLKEVKSQKDVEFIAEKLIYIADSGDVSLCLKTFKTINIAIEGIGDDKAHSLLARTLMDSPRLICSAMAACFHASQIQTFGINIVKSLPYYLEGRHEFGENGECDLLYLIMRRHIANVALCESGLECGTVLAAARYENKKHFGKLDGLRNMRYIMDSYATNTIVLSKCFKLLIAICTGCTEIQDAVRDSGYLNYLLTFLRTHQKNEDVVNCCSEVLYALFAQGNYDSNKILSSQSSIDFYMEILSNNVTSAVTCTAMSRLVMAIANESNDDVINTLIASNTARCLMQVLLNGKTNGIITKVVKLVSLFIVYFICNFPPMRNQFLSDDFIALFEEMSQSSKTNEQISKSIQVALKKLKKLQAKQSLNSALTFIDRQKGNARRKVAAKKIGRRASMFLENRRRFKVRREAEERMMSIAEEMDELSFFHEFHEALNLSVQLVQPTFALDVLCRVTEALKECGESSSKSPLGSSFLQNLDVIVNVMSAFLSFKDIQLAAIEIFENLNFNPDEYQNFGEKGGARLVLPLLQRHVSHSNICLRLLKCTGEYLQDETSLNRNILGEDKKQLKIISKIITIYMENGSFDLKYEFRSALHSFVQNLCYKSPVIKNRVCEIGITAQIIKFMLENAGDTSTVTSSCTVLVSLCDGLHQKNLGVVMSHENILNYVRIIRDYSNSLKVCKSVTSMLITLSNGGEKFIQVELSKSGVATELTTILGGFRVQQVEPKVEWTVIMLILHLVCNISSMTNEFIAANIPPLLEYYLTPEAEKEWELPVRQSADMALRKLRKYAKVKSMGVTRTDTSDVLSPPHG